VHLYFEVSIFTICKPVQNGILYLCLLKYFPFSIG
jgi:hypothetical protein